MSLKMLIATMIISSFSLMMCGHIETGKGKAEALRQLAQNSEYGIINFNATGYRYFVTEQPRPYEIVIFFSAPKCEFCEQMLIQYEQAAQYYYANNAHYPFNENAKKLRAVFYGVMTYDQPNRDIFIDLDFKSVPNLLVSVPNHAKVSDSERLNFIKGYKWQISASDGQVTHHKILEFINKRTGREIEYQAPLSDVFQGLAIFVIIVTLSIVVFRLFKPFFLNTSLWYVGSMVIYFFCIAGFVYNQLNDVPMTSVNKQGEMQWMLDNQRQQLGAEGFVMSGLIIFAGLSIIGWHFLARLSSKQTLSQLMFVAVFGITFITILKIEELYKFKGWYTIQFFPPAHYNRGPLMKDQGNTI